MPPLRLTAIAERVKLSIPGIAADTAREKLAEAHQQQISRKGTITPHKQYVDGREGAPFDAVKPDGIIFIKFQELGWIVREIVAALMLASPIGPPEHGHYMDDHHVYVNGAKVEVEDLDAIPNDAEVVVVNTRPYARKIEGGRMRRNKAQRQRGETKRRPGLSAQAPNGVYEITGDAMRRRFGNLVYIHFTYRGLAGAAYQPVGARPPKRGAKGRFISQGGPRTNADGRFPALVITAR